MSLCASSAPVRRHYGELVVKFEVVSHFPVPPACLFTWIETSAKAQDEIATLISRDLVNPYEGMISGDFDMCV